MGKINCKLVSFNFLSKKLHSAHSSKKYLPDNILAFSEFLSHFLCFYLYFVLYISMLRMFRITPPPQKKEKRNDPATSGDDGLSPFCSFCIDKVLNQ